MGMVGILVIILKQVKCFCSPSRRSSTHNEAFISSSEPSGSQDEFKVYPFSGIRRCRRCRQQCSNVFSSETKFYFETPWEGETIFIYK